MTWNYRVVQRKYPCGTVMHNVHEVYYDENGKPDGVTVNSVSVSSYEGIDGIKWVLARMQEATEKPVLDYDTDFPDREEDTGSGLQLQGGAPQVS